VVARTAAELRHQFDEGFAAPPPSPAATAESLLAIGLAGHPHALWLADVAGLFKDRRVTPLPGPVRDFLGVVALEGRLVPVYDLRGLLGYATAGAARWLVLVRAPEPLGLAFDSFEGQFTAPRGGGAATPADAPRHARQAVSAPDVLRTVVDVVSVVETVRNQAGRREPAKER
jgi:chemotaxis signal transduction protein